MRDSRHERLADVLVDYSAEVREGDLVLITALPSAAPRVREVTRRVLRAGGHPRVRFMLEEAQEVLLFDGSDTQLDWLNPRQQDEIEQADVLIGMDGVENTKSLSNAEPERQARLHRAREPVLTRYMERAAAGELRWVATAYPTRAAAQDAEMSVVEYEDFVYRAGFLEQDDPAGAWREFGESLEALAAFLGSRRELRILGEGTDLTIGVDGRRWIPAGGRTNFPDGEVFTGPVETRVDGTIRFTFPAVFQAREVRDVRLTFQGGEVVEATATRGEGFLRELIDMDEGARRVGEFAFGMNEAVDTFTRSTLFDEKMGGTVHLALGKSYPETGGENQSALHWDLVCDLRAASEVYADGELVYRDGRFLDSVA